MQELRTVVSLPIIRANAELVSRAAGKPLIAVVKDDAYGHGAERVAFALEPFVRAFAVATVTEGAALRAAGITSDILVLTPPLNREEALRIAGDGLIATLSSLRTLHFLAAAAPVRAHIAVNTGMNRFGVRPGRAGGLAAEAIASGVLVGGVYSHLYAPRCDRAREEQKTLFARAAEGVRAYAPGAVRHLSATGGLLAGDGFDAVRSGIALYGYLPDGFCGALAVRPAMKVYATVAERRVRLGGGAGYGFADDSLRTMHTLRVGYGDGFFRSGGIGVGTLCMDACVRRGYVRPGTRVAVLTDAAKYAAEHGTTAYEVLVRIGRRAERTYVE